MVAHLHTGLGWGGGEAQVLHLLLGLRERGIASVLLADERGALLARAHAAGVTVAPLRIDPWTRWLPSSLRPRWRAFDGLAVPLLLHAHDSPGLDAAAALADQRKLPLVLARRVASPLRQGPWTRRKYARPDRVIAVSHSVAAVLAWGGVAPHRIRVVPSGSDRAALEKASPARDLIEWAAGRPLVGGVGRLARKKDWPLLVRAAGLARRSGLEAGFVLAGDGPLRPSLEREARRQGASNLLFLGHRDDAPDVVRALDVLLHPSLAEGAPGVVRDAMLLGVPVVARDIPASRETLAGHGVLLAGADPQEAWAAIRKLLLDPDRRAAVARAARESARSRFDLAAMIDGTIAVYRELLDWPSAAGGAGGH